MPEATESRSKSSDADRLAPPHDDHAERAVLGALLHEPGLLRDIGNRLQPEDFYGESNRVVYQAILALEADGKPLDIILLASTLHERGLLQAAGGASHLASLQAFVATTANVGHWVGIVLELSTRRRLIAFGRETMALAGNPSGNVADVLSHVIQSAIELAVHKSRADVLHIRSALEPAIERASRLSESALRGTATGVPTGFHALDRMTSGFQPGNLVILAARPGMGKTALALNMLVNAATAWGRETPGAIFTLEMSAEELATRVWCSQARVPMEKVKSGGLSPADWRRLYDAAENLMRLPIHIDETSAITVAEMSRKCRQLKQQHGLGFVVVDYLQLMSSGMTSRNSNREQQISEISRGLKALAKDLGVPIVALSQLNRGVESRTDKRPLLSDLRESGAIEQDADIILFIYREDYYEQMKGKTEAAEGTARPRDAAAPPDPDGSGESELIIAKHRSGPTGKVSLLFTRSYTLFSNMVGDSPPPPTDADMPPRLQGGAPDRTGRDWDHPPPGPETSEAGTESLGGALRRVQATAFEAAPFDDDSDDDDLPY